MSFAGDEISATGIDKGKLDSILSANHLRPTSAKGEGKPVKAARIGLYRSWNANMHRRGHRRARFSNNTSSRSRLYITPTLSADACARDTTLSCSPIRKPARSWKVSAPALSLNATRGALGKKASTR